MDDKIYFKKLVIDSFQSHQHTEIKFKMGLNVITGKSDCGKSAILRAMRWLLYNEPRGIEFIRNGKKLASVSLTFNNDITITKERSKTINRYIISKPGEFQQVFEGFGNEVPLEVQQVHNMVKLILDDDLSQNINFATQLEEAFLISQPPSARAKALGKLGGIQIVDKAIRDGIADQKKLYQRVGNLEEDIKDNENQLLEYQNLDFASENLLNTSRLIENIDLITQKVKKLNEYKNNLNNVEQEISALEKSIKALENIDGSVKVIEACEKRLEQYTYILDRKTKYFKLNTEIIQNNEISDKYKGIDNIATKLDEMLLKNSKLKAVNNVYTKLKELQISINKGNEFVKSFARIEDLDKINAALLPTEKLFEQIKRLSKEYKSINNELNNGKKEIGVLEAKQVNISTELDIVLKEAGKCPLCGSILDDDAKNRMIN